MAIRLTACILVTTVLALVIAREAHAQAFGIELHNSLMPASGGTAAGPAIGHQRESGDVDAVSRHAVFFRRRLD